MNANEKIHDNKFKQLKEKLYAFMGRLTDEDLDVLFSGFFRGTAPGEKDPEVLKGLICDCIAEGADPQGIPYETSPFIEFFKEKRALGDWAKEEPWEEWATMVTNFAVQYRKMAMRAEGKGAQSGPLTEELVREEYTEGQLANEIVEKLGKLSAEQLKILALKHFQIPIGKGGASTPLKQRKAILESIALGRSPSGVVYEKNPFQEFFLELSGDMNGTEYAEWGHWMQAITVFGEMFRSLHLKKNIEKQDFPQDITDLPQADIPYFVQPLPKQNPNPEPGPASQFSDKVQPGFVPQSVGDVPEFYTNMFQVTVSPYDMRFDFGKRARLSSEKDTYSVSVSMSIMHVKDMVCLLLMQLASYEERHGAIPCGFELTASLRKKGTPTPGPIPVVGDKLN